MREKGKGGKRSTVESERRCHGLGSRFLARLETLAVAKPNSKSLKVAYNGNMSLAYPLCLLLCLGILSRLATRIRSRNPLSLGLAYHLLLASWLRPSALFLVLFSWLVLAFVPFLKSFVVQGAGLDVPAVSLVSVSGSPFSVSALSP